jgi:hypothetical protein
MKPLAYVICERCQKRYFVKEVEFLDIEEDIFGCDVMTFVCPEGHKAQKSNVFRA